MEIINNHAYYTDEEITKAEKEGEYFAKINWNYNTLKLESKIINSLINVEAKDYEKSKSIIEHYNIKMPDDFNSHYVDLHNIILTAPLLRSKGLDDILMKLNDFPQCDNIPNRTIYDFQVFYTALHNAIIENPAYALIQIEELPHYIKIPNKIINNAYHEKSISVITKYIDDLQIGSKKDISYSEGLVDYVEKGKLIHLKPDNSPKLSDISNVLSDNLQFLNTYDKAETKQKETIDKFYDFVKGNYDKCYYVGQIYDVVRSKRLPIELPTNLMYNSVLKEWKGVSLNIIENHEHKLEFRHNDKLLCDVNGNGIINPSTNLYNIVDTEKGRNELISIIHTNQSLLNEVFEKVNKELLKFKEQEKTPIENDQEHDDYENDR